jgi:hypothetical protein
VRDEARDKESELGLNNNGVRDEAREEEKSFLFGLFGRLGFRIFFFFFLAQFGLFVDAQ